MLNGKKILDNFFFELHCRYNKISDLILIIYIDRYDSKSSIIVFLDLDQSINRIDVNYNGQYTDLVQ